MSLSREQLQEMQAKLDALKADFLNNGGKVDKVHSNLESLGDHQPVIATKSALDKVVASQNKREVKPPAKNANKIEGSVKKQGKDESFSASPEKPSAELVSEGIQGVFEVTKIVGESLGKVLHRLPEINTDSTKKPAAKQKSVMSELRDINLAADEIERSISKMQRILRG